MQLARQRLRHHDPGGDAGLAGIALVIIIAWALTAVLLLTGTLIAARSIDDSVATITTEVQGIDEDTDAVALVMETNAIAADILTAAQPLSEHLDGVIAAAGSIDSTVDEILATAGEINTTAVSINGTVAEIRSTAGDINSTVGSIQGNVRGILDTARSINDGVAAINGRADRIIALVNGIKSDTGNILVQVGLEHGNNIHGHANSIDCSPGLLLTSSHCDQ